MVDAEREPEGTEVRGLGRLPDFLVIGAPRSGTTALWTYLAGNPAVFLPERKELDFFDRREVTVDSCAHYAAHFAGAPRDQVAGEASPLYLYAPEAAARMAAVVPDARLVASLRNPVDRAYSHYWWRRLWRAESRAFDVAVRDELQGRAPRGAEYLAHGYYAEQLDRLERYFPAASVLVVLFDDLCDDPVGTYRTLCGHIGAPSKPIPAVVGTQINTTTDVHLLWLARFTEPWRSGVRRRGGSLFRSVDRLNLKQLTPPSMDEWLRAELLDHFESPNAALAERLGRDLSVWNRPAQLRRR